MKKFLVALALFSLFCISAGAQDLPQVEVYGGYQMIHETFLTLHGFVGAVEGNVNEVFSIVGEYSFGYESVSAFDAEANIKEMTFMGGPRFSYRAERFRPFAHVLLGGNRISAGVNVPGYLSESGSITNFAMAFGGGVDISLNEGLSVRPAQLDILTTRVSMDGLTEWGNQLRYSAGIVFKFGEK